MSKHALAGFVTGTTGGLSRLWCDECQEEVLHRGNICAHCGAQHRAYPVRSLAQMMRNGPLTQGKRK